MRWLRKTNTQRSQHAMLNSVTSLTGHCTRNSQYKTCTLSIACKYMIKSAANHVNLLSAADTFGLTASLTTCSNRKRHLSDHAQNWIAITFDSCVREAETGYGATLWVSFGLGVSRSRRSSNPPYCSLWRKASALAAAACCRRSSSNWRRRSSSNWRCRRFSSSRCRLWAYRESALLEALINYFSFFKQHCHSKTAQQLAVLFLSPKFLMHSTNLSSSCRRRSASRRLLSSSSFNLHIKAHEICDDTLYVLTNKIPEPDKTTV